MFGQRYVPEWMRVFDLFVNCDPESLDQTRVYCQTEFGTLTQWQAPLDSAVGASVATTSIALLLPLPAFLQQAAFLCLLLWIQTISLEASQKYQPLGLTIAWTL